MLVSDIVWTPDPGLFQSHARLMTHNGTELLVFKSDGSDEYDAIYESRIKHVDLDLIGLQALLYHYDAAFVMKHHWK